MKKYLTSCFTIIAVASLSSAFSQTKTRIIEDGGTGPYSAIMVSEETLPTHTVFRPGNLSEFGNQKKLQIISRGNAACANTPTYHVNFLNEIASHGFLVIAVGPMPEEGDEHTGEYSTSSQLIDAIDWAIAQSRDPKSPYFNKIDTTRIAVSGMSCGGLQALEVAIDPRITTVGVFNSGTLPKPIPLENTPILTKNHLPKLHCPILYMLGGKSDRAYDFAMEDFELINHIPVFIANLDVDHNGTYHEPHGGEFGRVATAWFLWQLKNDKEAGKLFTGNPCGLSKSDQWTVDKNNIN